MPVWFLVLPLPRLILFTLSSLTLQQAHLITGGLVSAEGIGTLGMCVNFIVSIAVNKVTAEVPKDVQDLVESIRFPKGAGEAHDH